jgi:hypothetical protein
VEGGLVSQSSGTWMVAQSNGSVSGVSAPTIQRSFITYPRRPPEQTVLDWLLDRSPSKDSFPP